MSTQTTVITAAVAAALLIAVCEFFRVCLKAKIKWEPRDMWLGLYWDRKSTSLGDDAYIKSITTYRCYLCLIPCFPIIWTVNRVVVGKFAIQAVKEGALSRAYGMARTANPYQGNSKLHNGWDQGWVEADTVAFGQHKSA